MRKVVLPEFVFKNNSKNLLTIAPKFAKVRVHTVLEQQHTLQKIMRKTLLIAAAALAGSIISSQAQVYSQNVVGYANIPAVTAGKDYLITVPFAIGASNGINEVFGTNLPPNSQVLIWSVASSSFSIALYDPTDPNNVGAGAPVWYQSDDATPLVPLPTLPPGEGFFVVPGGPTTNTFAGAVAVNVGTSNNLALTQPGKDYLVASVVPYAGAVTNGNSSTGGPNLNNLPPNTELLIWSTATSSYTIALYDPTNPNNVANPPNWYFSDDATPYVDPATGGNVPTITVGQGFFIVPGGVYTWTTGL
jgi:hypothetical protein